MNPSANRDVVELWGREFNIVKSGLSEAQVVSFVNDLVKQHDLLIQRQEHLAALTKLAERTVAEADKVAGDMKKEAMEQAKSEAAKFAADTQEAAKADAGRIVADAESRAQKMLKDHEARAIAAASKQADSIKAEAEQAAAEAKKSAEANASRIFAEAESRGRHILEQKEAETLALAEEKAKSIVLTAEAEASAMLEVEKRRIQPELQKFVRDLYARLLSELEDLKTYVGSTEADFDRLLSAMGAEAGPPDSRREHRQMSDSLLEFADGSDGDGSEPEWEVEILPPIDIMKIMSIVGHLDSLPEVVKTEIIPHNDRTSVTVYLAQPLDLVSVMKSLPEVAQAEDTSGPEAEGRKLRKVSLSLSDKATAEGDTQGISGLPHHNS